MHRRQYDTDCCLKFNRYHQSEFRLKPRSRVIKDGWWAGATEGKINGQESLMLRYEGERKNAMKVGARYSNQMNSDAYEGQCRDGSEMSSYCRTSSEKVHPLCIPLAAHLQHYSHPNLPQMVGYSNDETPTPFILLANGRC